MRWLRGLGGASGPCKGQQGGQKEKGERGQVAYPKHEGFEKERHSPTHLYHFGLCVDYWGLKAGKLIKEGKMHPHLCKLNGTELVPSKFMLVLEELCRGGVWLPIPLKRLFGCGSFSKFFLNLLRKVASVLGFGFLSMKHVILVPLTKD